MKGSLGPYFFEDASGSGITVTGETSREMLSEYLLPLLGELDMQNFYFQQDGVTPHTTRETMAMPREVFPGRLISGSGDMASASSRFDFPRFFFCGNT